MGCNIFLPFLVYIDAKLREPTNDSMLQREDFDDLSKLRILHFLLYIFLSDKAMVLFSKSKVIPR